MPVPCAKFDVGYGARQYIVDRTSAERPKNGNPRAETLGKFDSSAFRQENLVDFVERYLGVSPDGGDGLLEVLITVLLVLMATAMWLCFTSQVPKT
jgi:hypothetical protein